MLAISDSLTITLNREERDALITHLSWAADHEKNSACGYGNYTIEFNRDAICHTQRFLAGYIQLSDALGWEPDPDRELYEVEVDDEVRWLIEGPIADVIEDNRAVDEESDAIEGGALWERLTPEGREWWVAEQAKRERRRQDMTAIVERIGGRVA